MANGYGLLYVKAQYGFKALKYLVGGRKKIQYEILWTALKVATD